MGPVRDYVSMGQRRHAGKVRPRDDVPARFELAHDLGDSDGVPDEDGVREDAEALTLFMIFSYSPLRKAPWFAKKSRSASWWRASPRLS